MYPFLLYVFYIIGSVACSALWRGTRLLGLHFVLIVECGKVEFCPLHYLQFV